MRHLAKVFGLPPLESNPVYSSRCDFKRLSLSLRECTLDSRHSSKDTRVYQPAWNPNGQNCSRFFAHAKLLKSCPGMDVTPTNEVERGFTIGVVVFALVTWQRGASHPKQEKIGVESGVESAVESAVRPAGVKQVAPRWASRMWLEASLQAWLSSELCLKRQKRNNIWRYTDI